nr:hypothetical protein [Polyangium spumosum]
MAQLRDALDTREEWIDDVLLLATHHDTLRNRPIVRRWSRHGIGGAEVTGHVRGPPCQEPRHLTIPESGQLDLVLAELERLAQRRSEPEPLVECPCKTDGRSVMDRSPHADDGLHVLLDRLRLGGRMAGVQHDTTNAAHDPEQVCQGRRGDRLGSPTIVLDQDLAVEILLARRIGGQHLPRDVDRTGGAAAPLAPPVPREVDDLWPVPEQRRLQVADTNGPLLHDLEALAFVCSAKALRDLADLPPERQTRGIGGVGSQEQDPNLGGHGDGHDGGRR